MSKYGPPPKDLTAVTKLPTSAMGGRMRGTQREGSELPDTTPQIIPETDKFPVTTIKPKPNNPKGAEAHSRVLTYNGLNAIHPIIYGGVNNVGAADVYWQAVPGGGFLVRYV